MNKESSVKTWLKKLGFVFSIPCTVIYVAIVVLVTDLEQFIQKVRDELKEERP